MLDRQLINLISGQRLIDMSFSYILGSNELVVSLNGQTLVPGTDYLELSPTQIYLTDIAESGEILELRKI